LRGSDDIIATSFPAADGGEASPLTSPPSELGRFYRIDSVEILRGLAALAVAWVHLTSGYKDQWVPATGSHGWLGVEIFFVISGFVIPFAIYRSFAQLSIREPLILTGLTLAACGGIMAIQDHSVQAIVGAATACLILMTTTRSLTEGLWRPFLGLGAISYSLYLVHVPVGGRVVNLLGRFIPDAPLAQLALSLSALAVSLVTAGIFWRCFEVPAQKLSRRVG